MSILGQATRAAATQPAEIAPPATAGDPLTLLWLFVPLGLVSLLIAWRAGVFRRNSIVGPRRVDDDESLGVILMLLGLAVCMLIVGQVALSSVGVKPARPTTVPSTSTSVVVTTAPTAQPPAPQDPERMALLLCGPALIALVLVTLAHSGLRRDGLRRLGLTASNFGRGVTQGLLGSLIMIPLVFLVSQLTEILWHVLHYEHPRAHELLKLIKDSPTPAISYALIAAAVVVAPLWEEFVFRGHLQTLFTYAGVRTKERLQGRPTSPPGAFEVIIPGSPAASIPTPLDPAPPPRAQPGAAARWGAIVVTSLCFAAIHPGLWMMPPIFFLSLCVGYAYERTGNLWVPITMHALFNSTSTILYFTLMH